jgi:hypothetical protein
MEVQLDAVDYADAVPFVRRTSEGIDVDTACHICRSRAPSFCTRHRAGTESAARAVSRQVQQSP